MKHVNQESGASTAHSDDGPIPQPSARHVNMARHKAAARVCGCIGASLALFYFIVSTNGLDAAKWSEW